MKTLLIVTAAVLVGVPLLIYGIGALLPVQHVAEGERDIAAGAIEVAGWVRNVGAQGEWRKDVQRIEILAPSPVLRYREVSGHGEIMFLFRELEAGHRFESTIDDPSLPFGGRWLISLYSQGHSTRVHIREEGEVHSPPFRFFSKFVFGHQRTLNQYLDDLAACAQRRGTVMTKPG